MPYITEAELPKLLRRYERVRLSSDARGQRDYVDIAAAWSAESEEARCNYPDCDIRGLTGAGIDRQWDGKGEVIRFELIRKVTVGRFERDAEGEIRYRPQATYQVIRNRKPAQVAA